MLRKGGLHLGLNWMGKCTRGVGGVAFVNPFTYNSNKDQWSDLPALPYAQFGLLAALDRKQLLAIGGSATKL